MRLTSAKCTQGTIKWDRTGFAMSDSFFERGKGFLDKGKCLLGFHQGTWEYRRQGDCLQFMVCQRCTTECSRVEHGWGDWAYRANEACELVRACARCGQTETAVKHVWDEPRYRSSKACEQVAVCTRCGEQEERPVLHRFDDWRYRQEDDCTQFEACSRCGQPGHATRLQHDWHDWTSSAFYQSRVRVCRRCGEMLVDAPGAPISMQAVEAAVDRLAAAGSWDEVRQQLNADQAMLLSPVTAKYLAFVRARYPREASEPLAVPDQILARCREVGVDRAIADLGGTAAPQPLQAAQPAETAARAHSGTASYNTGRLDQRLIGHWRSTEALMSGGFSMVTDSHCSLDRDGEFAFWSVSRSSLRNADSERKRGTWEAHDGELHLNFRGGHVWTKAYLVDGGSMIWPRDRRYRVWGRIK